MHGRAFRILYMESSEKKEVEIIHKCAFCDAALVKHRDGRTESVMPVYLELIQTFRGHQRYKTLKFAHRIPPYILAGEKKVTWRIGDDKNIEAGDIIKLATNDTPTEPGTVFGVAQVLWTKDTFFKYFSLEDKMNHDNYSSDEELYKTYSRYYSIPVGPDTPVKVIKFMLLSVPAAALPGKGD